MQITNITRLSFIESSISNDPQPRSEEAGVNRVAISVFSSAESLQTQQWGCLKKIQNFCCFVDNSRSRSPSAQEIKMTPYQDLSIENPTPINNELQTIKAEIHDLNEVAQASLNSSSNIDEQELENIQKKFIDIEERIKNIKAKDKKTPEWLNVKKKLESLDDCIEKLDENLNKTEITSQYDFEIGRY